MKKTLISLRNTVIGFLYKNVLKPVFFAFDPENVHDFMSYCGRILSKLFLTRDLTRLAFGFSDRVLEQKILGIKFKNPIGLSAGFDKDAELTDIMPNVGFGFEEIGSITVKSSFGNLKPRLWRLKKSEGLVVYYGLKNKGAKEVSERLQNKRFHFPIGTNIAMTNCKENLETSTAIEDYFNSFELFKNIGDYFTVNVSCPNALGGQPFMDPEKMDLLLSKIDEVSTKKPIFVKLSPDITFDEVDKIIDVLKKHKVDGIICSNLTKEKNNSKILEDLPTQLGGISGKPLQELSDNLISYIYKKEGKRFVIIGAGGVFSAEDAYKKIRAGASLIQMITGMVFEGPQVISEINLGLVRLLEKDGFSNISEAVGIGVK